LQFFSVKCCIKFWIELFFKNIAKSLHPGSHFGHLNKRVFSKKNGALSFIRNNFVTDKFNRKEQGVRWMKFSMTCQNKMLKIVNGGQG